MTETDGGAYAAAAVVSFAVTFLLMPRLIRAMKARGMVGRDQNKFDKPEVAEMGGVAVVAGFFAGAVTLMAFDSIRDQAVISSMPIFLAALIAALGAAFVGAVDDAFDLRQRTKAFLPILFGFPLAFLVADQAIHFPGGSSLYLGPLMIPVIAFMISAGANASNMLEGFNGLGAGLGLIMGGALALLSIYSGRGEAMLVLAPFLGATIAFLYFNRFPAKVFPGDTFTLFMGASLVAAAILVNLKEAAAVLFVPMIVEFFLKARARFTAETYGSPTEKGELSFKGEVGSLTHVMMRLGRRTEPQVVRSIWAVEAAIALVIVALIIV